MKGRRSGTVLLMPVEEAAAVAFLSLVLVAVGMVWLAVELAAVCGHGQAVPGNPFDLVAALARHRWAWRGADTLWLVAEAAVLGLGTAILVVRRGRGHHRIDREAKYLARNRDALRRYTDPDGGPGAENGPGPLIGRDLVGGRAVRARWEDVVVAIAGARMGKTTGWVVPAILDAPGPVYATSNKRDLVDMSRGTRELHGPLWVFDPQHITSSGEERTAPQWWWNPLDLATDVSGGRLLAGLFAATTRPLGSTPDAYFGPEGEELLALLLLAAACGNRPITDVYRWLTDPTNDEAVALLRDAGHAMGALGVRGVLDQPEKQRAGVVATAKTMVAWIGDPQLAEWVTDPGQARPRFSAAEFVASTGTLYGLSKEGPGSAGPLTAALTAGILLAAEQLASRSPDGRLRVPLVCALDEVANVVRWRDLPDLYSHYGSRGIVLMAFLQSWSQGVECWGREGMAKLWGSANLRVYGGGVSEAEFLENLSRLCGEVDLPTRSDSDSRFGPTISVSLRKERVFEVEALAALPPGRAVVMLSGADPVLVATESCFRGRHADAVRRSVAHYGIPSGATSS